MSNLERDTRGSLESRRSSLTANLRTLLLLLACALPACYALSRFENFGADRRAMTGDRGLHRVELNSAGLYELLLLEGVGEVTARKIIADRAASGPFASVDDLQRVKGIGPKTVEKLRPYVRIGASRPARAKSRGG